MSTPAQMQSYTRAQMEKLAENKDNIVLMETESKSETAKHKFKNEYLGAQIQNMRTLFEEYSAFYTQYTEPELRTKVLNSIEGREYSWMILATRYKFVFDVVLKKFTTPEDKQKYEKLLKMTTFDDMREKGLINSDLELKTAAKKLGIYEELYPAEYALEKAKLKK
jgi:hypothetical protein